MLQSQQALARWRLPISSAYLLSRITYSGTRASVQCCSAAAEAPARPSLSLDSTRELLNVGQASRQLEADSSARTEQPGLTKTSTQDYSVVSFYRLVDVVCPSQLLVEHQEFLSKRDIRGRIYISCQGINAQFSGPTSEATEYASWVAGQPLFQGLQWNCEPVSEHKFPRLRLRYRPNLVKLPSHVATLPVTEAAARATPLTPAQWQAMLPQEHVASPSVPSERPAPGSSEAAGNATAPATSPAGVADRHPQTGSTDASSTEAYEHIEAAGLQTGPSGRQVVVLDVRNQYEWDAGHFQAAERPLEDSFAETPLDGRGRHAVPAALRNVDPATTDVMMYCTGGIRCDIYSTHLKRQGFQRLYTLEGGVQRYLATQGPQGWNGSLFVFDDRMFISGGSGDEPGQAQPAAAPCLHCGGQAELPHRNCANIDCNDLFLSCAACREELQGCCSAECAQSAPRFLRPMAPGVFGRWTDLLGDSGADSEQADAQRMRAGRSGKTARKRSRRAGRLAEQRLQQERMRAERKQMMQDFMAERQAEMALSSRHQAIVHG